MFISLAEDMGVIQQLGEWVLEASCEHAALWRDRGIDLPVSVNLSAHQIEPELPALVGRVLERTGLAPESLVLEMTESVLMRDEGLVLPVLLEIRELGVRLALDDFGTGYSSLTYLRRYPVDRLKIDRSFVGELETNSEDRSLVRAILLMARALDVRVVAEGVETEWQRDFLRDHGCDLLQGYLIGCPMPPEELEAWLASGGPRGPGRSGGRKS